MMKATAGFFLLACSVWGQIPLCWPPTLNAIVAGNQQQAAPSTIYFWCTGLAEVPALIGLNCPTPIIIPATEAPGVPIYLGLTSTGLLHVSDGCAAPTGCSVLCAATATACYQDIFMVPAPGEFPIAIYTVGQGMKGTWTGQPALPLVTVLGCDQNGYTVSYAPGQITVRCQ